MAIVSSLKEISPTVTFSPAKKKLLEAALHVIRSKGYAATTVEDICTQADVTKGSFFHHFKSKDDLALAAVGYWRTMTESLFAGAPYHDAAGPLERLLGYLDFRGKILTGDLPDYTCLLGTLVQETYDTHPAIRVACEQALSSHVDELTREIQAAKKMRVPKATWTAESVGNLIQSVLQGAFIFAKAKQSPKTIRESLDHLRRYLQFLLQPATSAAVTSNPKPNPRRKK
jgi:TetR/AcrR family transcriptional repressor of nem operon